MPTTCPREPVEGELLRPWTDELGITAGINECLGDGEPWDLGWAVEAICR